ncbi:DUF6612 family protein [Paenibacillus sp. MMS18-CY102]|uniref:DUF6612 family protein n=1 Tax=Paenibacillus sp. MMS18-CY102 TaxID=2682849 RepID=UPI0013661752|nr:DUF6612 family protein [Paenibacillus sp. MMS18-CY102]MWC27274.1 hypothetical protein [Paenibacillus sp. MMS18-CY102]
MRLDTTSKHRNRPIHNSVRMLLAALLLIVGAIVLAACSSGEPAQQEKRAVPSASKAADGSAVSSDASAIREELKQSAEAAAKPTGWSIALKMDQELEENGQHSAMGMTSDGPVRREPLQMKQAIASEYGGKKSELETFLTADGYYMHDLASDDWTRMAKSVIPQVKETLSDYQIKPSVPLERLASVADKLQRSMDSGNQILYVYTGDGSDEGARAIIDDILRGTFGGSAMTQEVEDSIAVEQFEYKQAIDSQTKLPTKASLKLGLTIELQAGHRSSLSETLEVLYSKWNDSSAIIVPEAAKNAQEVTPPTPEQLEEVDKLLGQ